MSIRHSLLLLQLEDVPEYTLTAASGSMAITGQTAGLFYNRKLSVAGGSVVINGQSVDFTFIRKVAASAGNILIRVPDLFFTYDGDREHIARVVMKFLSQQPTVEISSEQSTINLKAKNININIQES